MYREYLMQMCMYFMYTNEQYVSYIMCIKKYILYIFLWSQMCHSFPIWLKTNFHITSGDRERTFDSDTLRNLASFLPLKDRQVTERHMQATYHRGILPIINKEFPQINQKKTNT